MLPLLLQRHACVAAAAASTASSSPGSASSPNPDPAASSYPTPSGPPSPPAAAASSPAADQSASTAGASSPPAPGAADLDDAEFEASLLAGAGDPEGAALWEDEAPSVAVALAPFTLEPFTQGDPVPFDIVPARAVCTALRSREEAGRKEEGSGSEARIGRDDGGLAGGEGGSGGGEGGGGGRARKKEKAMLSLEPHSISNSRLFARYRAGGGRRGKKGAQFAIHTVAHRAAAGRGALISPSPFLLPPTWALHIPTAARPDRGW